MSIQLDVAPKGDDHHITSPRRFKTKAQDSAPGMGHANPLQDEHLPVDPHHVKEAIPMSNSSSGLDAHQMLRCQLMVRDACNKKNSLYYPMYSTDAGKIKFDGCSKTTGGGVAKELEKTMSNLVGHGTDEMDYSGIILTYFKHCISYLQLSNRCSLPPNTLHCVEYGIAAYTGSVKMIILKGTI